MKRVKVRQTALLWENAERACLGRDGAMHKIHSGIYGANLSPFGQLGPLAFATVRNEAHLPPRLVSPLCATGHEAMNPERGGG